MSTDKHRGHAISTDAAMVATSTTSRLSVFSVMSGAAIWVKQTSSLAGYPFFSSDGQILACIHKRRIQFFDATSGHAIKEINIQVDDHDIWHAAISPQNDYIAVVFPDQVCIFRIEDGVMTWQSNETRTHCVWYLSDGKLANVYSNEQLVNGQTGESLDRFPFDERTVGGGFINSISVCPDTALLAVGPWGMGAPFQSGAHSQDNL
jgi:WD40 repeat protein